MKFEIWIDYEEQWDENHIDAPARVVEARNATEAAENYATAYGSTMDSEIAIIMRDPAGAYSRVELVKQWDVNVFEKVTLAELCAP